MLDTDNRSRCGVWKFLYVNLCGKRHFCLKIEKAFFLNKNRLFYNRVVFNLTINIKCINLLVVENFGLVVSETACVSRKCSQVEDGDGQCFVLYSNHMALLVNY